LAAKHLTANGELRNAAKLSDGKGMLGIYTHQLKDPRSGLLDYKGQNPLQNIYLTNSNPRRYLSDFYPTYDWVFDDGYS
jgi:hypothetical protein